MRQILVAVTFREFSGDVNSKIQQTFLDAIKKQTYTNYKLIVTNFREKSVKKELKKSELPFEFHQSTTEGIWHSFTEVIANTFSHLEKGKNILLWTNADNIFEPNFFEEIIKNFEPNTGGTSYPHMTYFSLEDFKNGFSIDTYHGNSIKSFYQLDPNLFVPDVIYLDGDIMLEEKNQNLFLEHYISGVWPGMAQTLMLAFYAPRLKNLIYKSVVANIQNVRTLGQLVRRRTAEALEREKKTVSTIAQQRRPEWDRNEKTMINFCKAKGISKRYWEIKLLQKLRQHKQYKVVGSLSQKIAYKFYFCRYAFYGTVKFVKRVKREPRKYLRKLLKFLFYY